jgi:hypothetical protein
VNLSPDRITETEAVSVTSMRGRLAREGVVRSRRVVRRALKRLVAAGAIYERRAIIRAMFSKRFR